VRNVILDSGAFSAWSRGEVLDIDAYIAFIFANAEHVDHYVNLDVIPGSFGVVPSPTEVEASARQSWDNLLYMEAHGLKPMPVFHMGEDFEWLRRIVNARAQRGRQLDYVGISPANDRPTAQKRKWLDRVFTTIGDADGRPMVKTHGLGVTSIPLLCATPGTAWIAARGRRQAARGVLFVPPLVDGQPRYDTSPLVIYMSGVKAQENDERDFRTLSPTLRKHVDRLHQRGRQHRRRVHHELPGACARVLLLLPAVREARPAGRGVQAAPRHILRGLSMRSLLEQASSGTRASQPSSTRSTSSSPTSTSSLRVQLRGG
jgi:hypothetical protein